jgi:hypothetical protein
VIELRADAPTEPFATAWSEVTSLLKAVFVAPEAWFTRSWNRGREDRTSWTMAWVFGGLEVAADSTCCASCCATWVACVHTELLPLAAVVVDVVGALVVVVPLLEFDELPPQADSPTLSRARKRTVPTVAADLNACRIDAPFPDGADKIPPEVNARALHVAAVWGEHHQRRSPHVHERPGRHPVQYCQR